MLVLKCLKCASLLLPLFHLHLLQIGVQIFFKIPAMFQIFRCRLIFHAIPLHVFLSCPLFLRYWIQLFAPNSVPQEIQFHTRAALIVRSSGPKITFVKKLGQSNIWPKPARTTCVNMSGQNLTVLRSSSSCKTSFMKNLQKQTITFDSKSMLTTLAWNTNQVLHSFSV